jgi:hypothetical protein
MVGTFPRKNAAAAGENFFPRPGFIYNLRFFYNVLSFEDF